MSPEMGPVSSQPSAVEKLLTTVGAWNMKAVVVFFNTVSALDDNEIRLDINPSDRRLTLHGRSSESGNQFQRGVLLGMTALLTILLNISLMSSVPTPDTALFALLSVAVLLPLSIGSIGSAYAMLYMEVGDLTTPKRGEDLDEIAEQYLEGEIDEAELERRGDEVVARE